MKTLTAENIAAAIEIRRSLTNWDAADVGLERLRKYFLSNVQHSDVLVKASAIDKLYSTRVGNVYWGRERSDSGDGGSSKAAVRRRPTDGDRRCGQGLAAQTRAASRNPQVRQLCFEILPLLRGRLGVPHLRLVRTRCSQGPADHPFSPYRGVWRPFPVTCNGQTYEDRALVVWSAGKHRLDEDKRKAHLRVLLDRLADIRGHLNRGRYIRREYAAHQVALAQRGNPAQGLVTVELTGTDRHLALQFQIDWAALALAQALDGKYLLGTNAAPLSANDALTNFKAQDAVEKSRFVASTSHLRFHHNTTLAKVGLCSERSLTSRW